LGGIHKGKNTMKIYKLFELITEIVGFIAIVISPFSIGLVLGSISFYFLGNDFGIIIASGFSILGLTFGILLAIKKWKGDGTVHFLSRISATPELDYPKDIYVKARVRLLSESEGGITTPLRTNVRPNHYFGVREYFGENMKTNIGEITFGEDFFYANEIKVVDVRFLWA